MANAFGSSKDFEESKNSIQFEYYPEDALSYASKNPKFAQKVESYLTEVVMHKSSRSFLNLTIGKRNFVTMYVYEHFKLEMCTYGGKGAGNASVTDVLWKEGGRVPEILVSEVIKLIEKGIMTANHETTRNSIFEASLILSSVPKGTSMDDLKKLLRGF